MGSKRMGKLLHQPPYTWILGKILVADVHRAQQTANVKKLLQINLPYLSMSHQAVQAEFSHSMFLSTSHLNMRFESSSRNTSENLHFYTENKLPVSERRVLTTKWVSEGWEKVSRNKEIIKRSFVKCGISHNLDGTEDNDINIEGILDYKLPQPDREFEMDDSSNEEDDNEVLTEGEEAVDDNESDSEGGSDSDSN